MNNENVNLTKVIVPCRFSYLHCWEPNAVNGSDPKYSVSAIIPNPIQKRLIRLRKRLSRRSKMRYQSGVEKCLET